MGTLAALWVALRLNETKLDPSYTRLPVTHHLPVSVAVTIADNPRC